MSCELNHCLNDDNLVEYLKYVIDVLKQFHAENRLDKYYELENVLRKLATTYKYDCKHYLLLKPFLLTYN